MHEVYLRLIDRRHANWQNRAQFFAVAARLIRRALIDQTRASRRQKRGGVLQPAPLSPTITGADGRMVNLLELEEALNELAKVSEEAVSVVEMRFFAGQTHQDIALVMGRSERSIRRHWTFAKAWLYRHMSEDEDDR